VSQVVDNPDRSRFELEERGLVAFADYRLHGDRLVIPHVRRPRPYAERERPAG